MDDIITLKNVTNPHTTSMFDTNIIDDYESQSFSTPRKHNHSENSQMYYVTLRSDFIKFQHNITHNMKCKKFLYLERCILV